jgi:hypothetical protein
MRLINLLKKIIGPKDLAYFVLMPLLSRRLKASHFNKILLLKEILDLVKKARKVKQAETIKRSD